MWTAIQKGSHLQSGKAAKRAAQRKIRSWRREVCAEEGKDFLPFALETYGHVGSEAADYLHWLSKRTSKIRGPFRTRMLICSSGSVFSLETLI